MALGLTCLSCHEVEAAKPWRMWRVRGLAGESVWPSTLDSLVWPRASVLAERLWLPDKVFGHGPERNGKGRFPSLWRGGGNLTEVY